MPGLRQSCMTAGWFRIHGKAKTVWDALRFRHKIGVEVALEALKTFLRLGPVGASQGHQGGRHPDGRVLVTVWDRPPIDRTDAYPGANQGIKAVLQ